MSHLYVLLSESGEVLSERSLRSEVQPDQVRKFASGQPVLVPLIVEPKPPLLAGQRHGEPVYHVEGGRAYKRWPIERISQDELYQQKKSAARLPPLERAVISSLMDRVRALEGKPAMTPEQFDQWLLGLAQSIERESK